MAAALKSLEKEEKSKKRRWSRGSNKSDEVRTQNEALEVTKQVQELENNVEEFERSKVNNVKSWLQLYLHSSLAYHVRAVEEYTKAYQSLSSVDIIEHIAHLKEKLYPSDSTARMKVVRWNSFNSLNMKS